jgi:hypothetical protein
VPIGVKDVILVKDVRNTCASRLLEKFVAPYDATAVTRLEAAGGIIIGKTNCDEFAMGSSNENSCVRPGAEPGRTRPCPGRFERRLGGGGRTRNSSGLARLRHRRLHPATGFVLRRGGRNSHIWTCFPLRFDSLRQLARSYRSVFP